MKKLLLSLLFVTLNIPTLLASFDILQEAAGHVYCKYSADGVICDAFGLRICKNSQCVTICASIGLEQCLCSANSIYDENCHYCCGGSTQQCAKLVDFGRRFGVKIPDYLYETRPEYCPDPCPSDAVNGRVCKMPNYRISLNDLPLNYSSAKMVMLYLRPQFLTH